MKSLFLKSLFLTLGLISFSTPNYAQGFEGFELTDDEKKQLDEQLESFVEAFNNLPPEEMRKLEEMNAKLERKMKKKGLDPENMDDIFSFAEKKIEKEAAKAKEAAENSTEAPASQELTKPIEFKMPSQDSDASTMLLNLVTYIAELRQKSISYDEMNKKLERFSSELNELSYFLHSLTNPDLMKHLLSKDFETLYKNLEALYQILAKQTPSIQSKEIEATDIENPYQALGLSNQASMEEVEDAYQNLKEMFDPTKIEEQLQKQNASGPDIAKTIKQAKISFSFIQDAYDELKDPKQKAILDRKLREELENQERIEKLSYKAFDEIYKVFTDKLFPILSDIKKLFEKYRPEEISKAKQHDDREKKLLAESKKPFKIIKGDNRIKFKEKSGGEYEEFYKDLAQKEKSFKAPSSYKPLFDDSYKSDFFEDKGKSSKSPEKPKGKDAGGEKKPGKEDKKDDKKDDKKKDEGKKEEKKDDKSKGGSEKKPSSKEPEQLAEIGSLANLLENAAKTDKKVEVPRMIPTATRSAENGEAKPEVEKVQIKLDDIKKGLNDYLTSDPAQITTKDKQFKDIEPLNDFLVFAKQNEIEKIATGLKKLAPKPNEKIESEAVSKMLKDKILKHKSLIETWYKDFYTLLSPTLRRETPNMAAININKQNIHRLGTKSSSKEDTDAATALANTAHTSFNYIPNENLYKVREFLKGMHDAITGIEKALGVKSEPKK